MIIRPPVLSSTPISIAPSGPDMTPRKGAVVAQMRHLLCMVRERKDRQRMGQPPDNRRACICPGVKFKLSALVLTVIWFTRNALICVRWENRPCKDAAGSSGGSKRTRCLPADQDCGTACLKDCATASGDLVRFGGGTIARPSDRTAGQPAPRRRHIHTPILYSKRIAIRRGVRTPISSGEPL
jgi:hypothetical protein